MKIPASIIKKNWPIILIVGLSLFLRLFRVSSYMTFLGDEGRDSLVWLRMITLGKFTLIGPQTSIGNMYLGPLYYYLMLPFYIMFGTIGPSVGVASFAGVTTFLLWFFGREWFSNKVGLLAAFLYAISPVAIVLSRSSWNPNVMPLFALLIIWGIWQFWQKDKYWWLAVAGVTLSFAIQSHYLGILLIPVIGLFWLIKLISLIKKQSKALKKFLVFTFIFTICFLVFTIIPLVWFDLRHNFINYQAFYKFFSERQTTVNFRPYKAIPNFWPLWQMLLTRLIAGKQEIVGFWVSLVVFLSTAGVVFGLLIEKKTKELPKSFGFFGLLIAWLAIGLFGMGLYKQHIYDHYFGFLFPAIFLLTGLVLEGIWNLKKIGKIVFGVVLCLLIFVNLKENPLKYPPNLQMAHTAEVDKKIIKEAQGKAFNLGMIAKQNYDAGYRYFLEKWEYKAVEIDAQRPDETITEQLFVVCEIQDCQPIGHPQAEIANFGWVKIDEVWDFPWGTKLFKLVHAK